MVASTTMWLRALSPIKIAPGVVVGEDSPPFELDFGAALELLALGAAVEQQPLPTLPPLPEKKAAK